MCYLSNSNLYIEKIVKKKLIQNYMLTRSYLYKNFRLKKLIKPPRSSNKSLWYFLKKKTYINFFPIIWKPRDTFNILLFQQKLWSKNSSSGNDDSSSVKLLSNTLISLSNSSSIHSSNSSFVVSYITTAVLYQNKINLDLLRYKSQSNIIRFPFNFFSKNLQNITQIYPTRILINWHIFFFMLIIPHNDLFQRFLFSEIFSLKWIKEISRVLYFFLFLKLKYKGKSYKWFKKKISIILRFGYSHIVIRKIPNYFFSKKIGKMKLIFFGTSLCELRSFFSELISWRPMNIYNGRGLRFARQRVFRKFGKVSAYR